MKLIVPCCGRSSRFPNLPPKWMLPSADGQPMICAALAGLKFPAGDVVVTVLREHEERFGAAKGLAAAFGSSIRVCILERQTHSQSETVAETLRALKLDEPFLVKDSDGSFVLDAAEADVNYVCVASLHDHPQMNARNKSYVRVDERGQITEIREKSVISDSFNVGGYFFRSPQQFLEYYDRLADRSVTEARELYLSAVIAEMLADGIPFGARSVSEYRDWGTIEDWRRWLGASKTLLVALDGFVFEQGNPFFHPRYDETRPNQPVVQALKHLVTEGVGLVFLSRREDRWKEVTERQLAAAELPIGPIVFNCSTGKWLLVGGLDEATAVDSVDAGQMAPADPRVARRLEELLGGCKAPLS